MRKFVHPLAVVAILTIVASSAIAETQYVSWDPVTTYTDTTPIESGKTVSYTVYWTSDAGLTANSLHQIASSLSSTSTSFDPDQQGMTRGQTVYFTAKAVLNTGETSSLATAYSWVVPVVTPPSSSLSGLTIGGPASVNEGTTATYTATATWDNGTTRTVTPTWSENSSVTTISSGGLLTASALTSTQSVTVTASYTSGGITKSATKTVSIVNVAGKSPSAPGHIGIKAKLTTSGSTPLAASEPQGWQVVWDPVTNYTDGSPIEAGRTVRYIPYWTNDPEYSSGSLHALSTSVTATAIDFDPTVAQMVKNEVAYLLVKTILDSGDESSGGPVVSWRVENAGPVAPTGGQLIRRK